eukprot:gene12879-15219_t
MQTAGGDGGEEGEEEEEEQGVEEEVAGADPPGSPGPRRVASGKVRSHLNHESMADERSVAQAVTLVLNQFLCNSDLGRHITIHTVNYYEQCESTGDLGTYYWHINTHGHYETVV